MAEPRPLPLFAWADAVRAARRRRRSTLGIAIAAATLCAAATATALHPPLPRLVWNASGSAPIGLYRLDPGAFAAKDDMVVARTPASVRALAARRHYIPADVPLVKRIAAAGGERVCALGAVIAIDGRVVAMRRRADAAGRRLPWWHGCVRLDRATVLLLMADVADSFDGRYFGPSARGDVIGKATPLWLR